MGLFFSRSQKEPEEETDKKKELQTRMLLDAIKNREHKSDKENEKDVKNGESKDDEKNDTESKNLDILTFGLL